MARIVAAGWWTPEVSDSEVPDADLSYPANDPAGSGAAAALAYPADSRRLNEPASEAANGPYAGRFESVDAESASSAAQARSLLAAASCGSAAGYSGLSLAFVGLLAIVAWAWRHGLRTGRCVDNPLLRFAITLFIVYRSKKCQLSRMPGVVVVSALRAGHNG